jgi:glutamyl-tRNA(Gln) amidotransferase subunit D
VFVVFAGATDLPGWVDVGTRVRKVRAGGQTFYSINWLPVGKVVGENLHWIQRPPRPEDGRFAMALERRVLFLKLYPGLDLARLAPRLAAGEIGGVVLELYPAGTGPDAPGDFSLREFVRTCTERGIPVFTTVSVAGEGQGRLEYRSSRAIREAGATFLRDMLPETATVKVMWALAQDGFPGAVVERMLKPVFGEISGPWES